jgi:hypothetical protein
MSPCPVAVFGDEAAQVAHLDVVVAFVGAWTELDFLTSMIFCLLLASAAFSVPGI